MRERVSNWKTISSRKPKGELKTTKNRKSSAHRRSRHTHYAEPKNKVTHSRSRRICNILTWELRRRCSLKNSGNISREMGKWKKHFAHGKTNSDKIKPKRLTAGARSVQTNSGIVSGRLPIDVRQSVTFHDKMNRILVASTDERTANEMV